jgi:hypothetical protein
VTETWGLVFDHYAYSIQKQVEFKEDFYGYSGLVDGWKELQKTSGPVRLSQYFHHLQDKSVADDR